MHPKYMKIFDCCCFKSSAIFTFTQKNYKMEKITQDTKRKTQQRDEKESKTIINAHLELIQP